MLLGDKYVQARSLYKIVNMMLQTIPRLVSDKELCVLLENTGVTLSKKPERSFSRMAFLFTHIILAIFFVDLLLHIFKCQDH